jgi:hypothetical protein
MRRHVVLGAWYAVLVAGLIAAEEFTVTVKEGFLYKEPDPWSDAVGSLEFGTTVKTTGDAKDDFLPVEGGGKKGWIARADVVEPGEFKAGAAGGGAGAGAQEGAYVKGFDPEVEEKARADDATLDRMMREQVLPLVWEVRGSRELEEAEEALEKLQIQSQGNSPEAEALKKRIESLRAQTEPLRAARSSALRAFRKEGGVGEFAGRK